MNGCFSIHCVTSLLYNIYGISDVDKHLLDFISKEEIKNWHSEPATTATSLLPCSIRRYGSAILDPANLHASPGQSSQSGLGSRSRGLGAVTSGGSQLDVQGSDPEGFHLNQTGIIF